MEPREVGVDWREAIVVGQQIFGDGVDGDLENDRLTVDIDLGVLQLTADNDSEDTASYWLNPNDRII